MKKEYALEGKNQGTCSALKNQEVIFYSRRSGWLLVVIGGSWRSLLVTTYLDIPSAEQGHWLTVVGVGGSGQAGIG